MIKDMEELNRIIAADSDGVEAQVFSVAAEAWADSLQTLVEHVRTAGAYVTASEFKLLAQNVAKEYGFLVEGDEIVTGIDHDAQEERLRDAPVMVKVDRTLLEAAVKEIREWKVDKGGDDQVVLNLEATLK